MAWLTILVLFIPAGGCLKPPAECPFAGTADAALFNHQFDNMLLVAEGASAPPLEKDEFLQFQKNDRIELLVVSKSAGQL